MVEINRLLEQWSHEVTPTDFNDMECPPGNGGTPRSGGGNDNNGLMTGVLNVELSSLPHNNESNWYLPDFNRNAAEKLLSGKLHGTFLVRRSRDNRHALSISCNGVVEHCIIEETDRGIGFAEPYNIYANLKELVLHYSQNSLEEYNDKLTTKLAYPINVILEQERLLLIQQRQPQPALATYQQ